jgi:hypothetical protein
MIKKLSKYKYEKEEKKGGNERPLLFLKAQIIKD